MTTTFLTLLPLLTLLSLGSGAGYGQDRARIYISTNHGLSWEGSDAGFPPLGTVNDFGRLDRLIFAGTDAHGVFVSKDDGRSWMPAAAGLPPNVKVNAIASAQDLVFVGTHRDGVFASADSGQTWHPANEGLPNQELRCLVVHQGRLFAGTNAGLFGSDDHGKSWRHLSGEGQINAITVLADDIYAADLQGVVLSTNLGETWRRILEGGTPHNLSNDGVSVFAMMYAQGVKKTAKEGAAWVRAQSGLPADLAWYTFQIISSGRALFAAQWDGIYLSRDRGTSWTLSSQGLPPGQPIKELIHLREGTILAGAGGIRTE